MVILHDAIKPIQIGVWKKRQKTISFQKTD